MGWTEEMMISFKSIRIRQALHQVSGIIVASALIIWKWLMCITGTESPVVVILTESMELGFGRFYTPGKRTYQLHQQGDILFLHMSKDPIRVGEIVVYNINVHERRDTGEVDVLTKGDNNLEDDISLYNGELWLQLAAPYHRKSCGFLPYVGYVTIVMTDKPIIKYVLIGVLGFLVIISKDRTF